jgi:hypothetical protein
LRPREESHGLAATLLERKPVQDADAVGIVTRKLANPLQRLDRRLDLGRDLRASLADPLKVALLLLLELAVRLLVALVVGEFGVRGPDPEYPTEGACIFRHASTP